MIQAIDERLKFMSKISKSTKTKILFIVIDGLGGLPHPEYASDDYQDLLTQARMVASMSRKGNCYDNAPVESFFATLKTELIFHQQYATKAEARLDIFEYIEAFYNRFRRHSALGYKSPVKYEALPFVA